MWQFNPRKQRKTTGSPININYSSLDFPNFSFLSFIPCHLFGNFIISYGNGLGNRVYLVCLVYLAKGFSMRMPSIFCSWFKSSVRISSTFARQAAAMISASQKDKRCLSSSQGRYTQMRQKNRNHPLSPKQSVKLFNPVFHMQTNNSFKFFGIVGHQCHVP